MGEKYPRIVAVEPLVNWRLLVTFNNEVSKIYDCAPLLLRPQFHLLTDPGFFRAVRVDSGGYGVSWNDDVDLSEYELWTNGKLTADDSFQPTALPRGG